MRQQHSAQKKEISCFQKPSYEVGEHAMFARMPVTHLRCLTSPGRIETKINLETHFLNREISSKQPVDAPSKRKA